MIPPQSVIQRLIFNQELSGLTNLTITITNDGDGGQPCVYLIQPLTCAIFPSCTLTLT